MSRKRHGLITTLFTLQYSFNLPPMSTNQTPTHLSFHPHTNFNLPTLSTKSHLRPVVRFNLVMFLIPTMRLHNSQPCTNPSILTTLEMPAPADTLPQLPALSSIISKHLPTVQFMMLPHAAMMHQPRPSSPSYFVRYVLLLLAFSHMLEWMSNSTCMGE